MRLGGVWKVLTGVVLVVVAVWRPGVASVGGAVVGGWAVLAAVQVGLLVGALVAGVRVSLVVIGVGGEVRTWTRPGRRVVWRNVPLLMSVGLTSVRESVRVRLWSAAFVAAVVVAGVVGAAWAAAGHDFWRGFAVAGTAVAVNALWPRRKPGTTSVGWFLFALPRLTGRPLEEYEATPLLNRVTDAIAVGDLDRAEALSDELVARHPELLVASGARVAVLGLRARYLEALQVMGAVARREDLGPRDMAFVMAQMAGSTVNAVEGGMLPAEFGVPAARSALDGAVRLGYPRYRCAGALARLALLEDDHATALTLANQARQTSEDGLDRADALATMARAQMAAGDNAAARATLVEAEQLAGWMPRVAETSARLNIR
ncbi:hypothetical protein Q5530_28460 [Saccharothrix sp. BKS2]|uniref:Tetratricopeptide repeat protein n=1 Tax=Saccharothrix lopnurensis TaxID=1670621 RepID=A0ABW1PG63_9PSEU